MKEIHLMDLELSCPKCRRALAATAPLGLCTYCLMDRALGVSGEVDEECSHGNDASDFAASLLQGQRFGDHEILEIIAQGGMGAVYKARQTRLNRLVALKLIHATALASRDGVKRFRNEAEAAASLDHPNIVPIYEVGEHRGQHFFSMRLIEGGTLMSAVEGATDFSVQTGTEVSKRLRTAVKLVEKMARAIHYAHQRGVLHRDIKPGNILLDPQGEPHLIDFGLAKLLENESALTRTIAVLGTPSYMSPEQAAGQARQLTTAADVYGLGAVLYELVTGQPPFAAGTSMETVRHVIEKAPRRPSVLNRRVDRDLETICLKCLEKEPRRRYSTAEALAEDLRRWQADEPIHARPASGIERFTKSIRRQPKAFALVTGAALVLSLLFITLLVSNVRTRRAAAQETVARIRAEAKLEEVRRQLEAVNAAAELRAVSSTAQNR